MAPTLRATTHKPAAILDPDEGLRVSVPSATKLAPPRPPRPPRPRRSGNGEQSPDLPPHIPRASYMTKLCSFASYGTQKLSPRRRRGLFNGPARTGVGLSTGCFESIGTQTGASGQAGRSSEPPGGGSAASTSRAYGGTSSGTPASRRSSSSCAPSARTSKSGSQKTLPTKATSPPPTRVHTFLPPEGGRLSLRQPLPRPRPFGFRRARVDLRACPRPSRIPARLPATERSPHADR